MSRSLIFEFWMLVLLLAFASAACGGDSSSSGGAADGDVGDEVSGDTTIEDTTVDDTAVEDTGADTAVDDTGADTAVDDTGADMVADVVDDAGADTSDPVEEIVELTAGDFYVSADNGRVISFDFDAETTDELEVGNFLSGIAAGGSFMVYGGQFTEDAGNPAWALYSADGGTWTDVSPPLAEPNSPFGSMAYGDGRWVASGGNASGGIYYSDDNGTTWTAATTPPSSGSQGSMIYGEYDEAGRFFVSPANGTVAYSDDGDVWTVGAETHHTVQAIAIGNDRVIALGNSFWAFYSDDGGDTWTNTAGANNAQYESAIYADGQFVAVGRTGHIIYSADGITWTNADTPEGVTSRLQNVTYHSTLEIYIAVGGDFMTIGTDVILTSADGQTWTEHPFTSVVEEPYMLTGVAAAN